MSTKHTTEPWCFDQDDFQILSGEFEVANCWTSDGDMEQRKSNASRIVQCVNAMEGIEDPKKLRETWEVVKELELDRYPKLKARYDEVIDLLKLCKARFEVKSDILQSPTIIARIDEVLKKHEPCQEQ